MSLFHDLNVLKTTDMHSDETFRTSEIYDMLYYIATACTVNNEIRFHKMQ